MFALGSSAADFPPTGWGLQSQANCNQSPEEKQNQTYISDERLDCQAPEPQQFATNTWVALKSSVVTLCGVVANCDVNA